MNKVVAACSEKWMRKGDVNVLLITTYRPQSIPDNGNLGPRFGTCTSERSSHDLVETPSGQKRLGPHYEMVFLQGTGWARNTQVDNGRHWGFIFEENVPERIQHSKWTTPILFF